MRFRCSPPLAVAMLSLIFSVCAFIPSSPVAFKPIAFRWVSTSTPVTAGNWVTLMCSVSLVKSEFDASDEFPGNIDERLVRPLGVCDNLYYVDSFAFVCKPFYQPGFREYEYVWFHVIEKINDCLFFPLFFSDLTLSVATLIVVRLLLLLLSVNSDESTMWLVDSYTSC